MPRQKVAAQNEPSHRLLRGHQLHKHSNRAASCRPVYAIRIRPTQETTLSGYPRYMRATVHFKLPNGEVHALGHGAIIGRLWSANLQLNDGRVSEAHAMVSLRGRDLRLLALRGRFGLHGKPLSDLVLREGQRIAFASGLQLEVVRVEVPDELLALEADGVARQVLSGVTALYGGSNPRMVAGWHSAAPCHIWPTGASWMRGTNNNPEVIAPGDSWQVDGVPFRAVEERNRNSQATVRDQDFTRTLRIVNRFDTIHLLRQNEPVVVITGRGARLISELACTGCAMSWEDLAALLWDESRREVVRRRWDMLLLRLRQKLRQHGIRPDLVRADGSGLVELVLGPGDELIDET